MRRLSTVKTLSVFALTWLLIFLGQCVYGQPGKIDGCLNIKAASICSVVVGPTLPKLANPNNWAIRQPFNYGWNSPTSITDTTWRLWAWTGVNFADTAGIASVTDSARVAASAWKLTALLLSIYPVPTGHIVVDSAGVPVDSVARLGKANTWKADQTFKGDITLAATAGDRKILISGGYDLRMMCAGNINFASNSYTPLRLFQGNMALSYNGHNFNIGGTDDADLGFFADRTGATTWRAKQANPTLIRSTLGNLIFYTDFGMTPNATYTPTERLRITATGKDSIANNGQLYSPYSKEDTTLFKKSTWGVTVFSIRDSTLDSARTQKAETVYVTKRVGIGTIVPTCRLEVAGSEGDPSLTPASNPQLFRFGGTGGNTRMDFGSMASSPYNFWFQARDIGGAGASKGINLQPLGGGVMIGSTSNPDSTLTVAGGIHGTNLKIDTKITTPTCSISSRLAAVHLRSWSATQDSIRRYWAQFGKVDTIQTDSLNARRIIATAGINHSDTAWYLVAPCPVDLWANSIKKNDNDTLLRLWDGPPKTATLYAFIVRGKPLQYTAPKLNATASSGVDLGPILARLDSTEMKLTRTRRDLAREVKKRKDLETTYGKGK